MRASAPAEWSSYVDHAFVRQMETGRLPRAAFQTDVVKDYPFLIPALSPEIFGARLRADSARRVAIDGQRWLLFMLEELRKTVEGRRSRHAGRTVIFSLDGPSQTLSRVWICTGLRRELPR